MEERLRGVQKRLKEIDSARFLERGFKMITTKFSIKNSSRGTKNLVRSG